MNPELVQTLLIAIAVVVAISAAALVGIVAWNRNVSRKIEAMSQDFGHMQNAVIRQLAAKTAVPPPMPSEKLFETRRRRTKSNTKYAR